MTFFRPAGVSYTLPANDRPFETVPLLFDAPFLGTPIEEDGTRACSRLTIPN